MGLIHGALGLPDIDDTYVNVIGQSIVYDASQNLLAQYNADLDSAKALFVENSTEDFKQRYKLPGGGRLQRRQEQTATQAVKASGGWDVGFPLEDFGARILADDITLAKMGLQEYSRHIDTVFIQDANTYRFEMLRAIYNNTARTFVDPLKGSIIVQPLANGDSVLYPPVIGSEVEATDDHYKVSGYLSSAISDVNNPFPVIVEELEDNFGATQGGSNIVVFINPAQSAKVMALLDFVDYTDRFIVPGDNTATVTGLPRVPASARIIGRVSGAWVAEWRWVPADYMLAIHADAPPPLRERIDPPAQGLGTGLQLVARDREYPLESAHYRHRFGLGVGNRLNGVVMQFKASGSYDIPAIYV